VIPDAAVEAAAEGLALQAWGDWAYVPDALRRLFLRDARLALEAAAPILLSHEREETRLAHVDAVVNAETVDRIEAELEAERKKVVLLLSAQSRPAALPALAKAWDDGRQAGHDFMIGKQADNPYRS